VELPVLRKKVRGALVAGLGGSGVRSQEVAELARSSLRIANSKLSSSQR